MSFSIIFERIKIDLHLILKLLSHLISSLISNISSKQIQKYRLKFIHQMKKKKQSDFVISSIACHY